MGFPYTYSSQPLKVRGLWSMKARNSFLFNPSVPSSNPTLALKKEIEEASEHTGVIGSCFCQSLFLAHRVSLTEGVEGGIS